MQAEHAPPGFWKWPESSRLVPGVIVESAVPTRFFQALDAYPGEWGRLWWRLQLNRLLDERVELPVFRTFYPGTEWNLRRPDHRWFLTGWFTWQGPGPEAAAELEPPQVEGDTVLFPFAAGRYLRTRVDARDRREIAAEVAEDEDHREGAGHEHEDPSLIVIDDVISSL